MTQHSRHSRWQNILPIATALMILLLVIFAAWGLLWHWPQQAAKDLRQGPDSSPEVRRQVQELENARVATGAEILLALGILVGIYLTYRRIRATERQATNSLKQAETANRHLQLAQRQQTAERFTQAIEQLGSSEISIRLGGVYSLEKIAQDGPARYFSQFREVLCAFVRENTSEPRVNEEGQLIPLDTDLQAALTVLGRNPPPPQLDKFARIDLSGAHLEGANLHKAHLEGANLTQASLDSVRLSRANLRNAHLAGTKLRNADLTEANLKDAFLKMANLENASVTGVCLRDACLNSANLSKMKASVIGIPFFDSTGNKRAQALLERVPLEDLSPDDTVIQYMTTFEGASLFGANLASAKLARVSLKGADLTKARYNEKTSFPSDFTPSEDMIYVQRESDQNNPSGSSSS